MDPPLRLYQTNPTTRILSTTPLSKAAASYRLSTFLALAQKDALYHPSHQLTHDGIVFPQVASNTSGADKLRVLGFIAQGLEGERVEADTANEVLREMGEKLRRERDEGEFSRKAFGEAAGQQWGTKRKFERHGDADGGKEESVKSEDKEIDALPYIDAVAGAEVDNVQVGRVLSPMEEESQIAREDAPPIKEESQILLTAEEEVKVRRKEEKMRKREERKRLKVEKRA